jgi:hypothetical protein
MGDFLNRHSYLVIWITALILIGGAALVIFDLNGYIPTLSIPGISQAPATPTPQPPAIPAPPSVSFVVQKSKSGNSFFVQWQNLPTGTTGLNIFRGKTGTPENTWLLWRTLSISSGDLTNGNGEINLGTTNEDGYSFYVQAINGGGGGDGGVPLWTSSSTAPIVTTSTPEQPGNDGGQNPPTPSSTPGNNPPNNPPPGQNPSSTGQSNNNPPTPTGTPYYSPEVQISGYGAAQTGNFWVQHVDQKIQIGWQNLPPEAIDVVINRSQNQNGPWATVLEQQNSGGTGSYSIQLVDDTFGVPFYYELNAMVGTSTIATYGPVYLQPEN